MQRTASFFEYRIALSQKGCFLSRELLLGVLQHSQRCFTLVPVHAVI